MKQRGILFPCGELELEGTLHLPDNNGIFPGVVLCHPHPLYGGSMHNNVILATASALTNNGIAAFMFNFRGVGRSQGSFGGGVTEQDDAKAAISWLGTQPEVSTDNVGLLGYSFGASVVVPVACADTRVKAFVLVSPALEPSHHEHLKTCDKPKLIISGKSDTLVSVESVEMAFSEAGEPKQLEMIASADHFWWGHEKAMADSVSIYLKKRFATEA